MVVRWVWPEAEACVNYKQNRETRERWRGEEMERQRKRSRSITEEKRVCKQSPQCGGAVGTATVALGSSTHTHKRKKERQNVRRLFFGGFLRVFANRKSQFANRPTNSIRGESNERIDRKNRETTKNAERRK